VSAHEAPPVLPGGARRLTGLINRREFESRLNSAIESARADKSNRHAMIYVDRDQFKVVNDTCGHPAGDQLLRQVTGILQTRVRANDVLARLGGDEFGVLLEHCTPDQALRIADTMRQAIHDLRFQWGTNTMQIGASIGIVQIDQATESVATLLSAATSPAIPRRTADATACRSTTRPAPRPGTARCAGWRGSRMRATRAASTSCSSRSSVAETSKERPHYELLLRLTRKRNDRPAGRFIPAAGAST
jgi:diguanylate cyclase (GGDEF)-like protein